MRQAGTAADIVPIVLAAGQGRRLGGNKALLDLGGTPALLRILGTIASAGLEVVIVVIGHDGERVCAMIDGETQYSTTTIVVNPDPERGQTSSVQCGIAALPPIARATLVWPVDHPLVSPDDVRAITTRAAAHPEATVVLPTHAGRNGHPVLLARALFPRLLALAPETPLRNLVRGERERTSFVERPTDAILRDLDTPADLAAARRLLGAGRAR